MNRFRNSFLLFASFIAVVALGSTLAANINISTGNRVEYGQGVETTTTCDNSVLVTPTSRFENATGTGSFKLATITLSGISDTCFGKDFTIKAFGESSSTPLDLLTGISSINVAMGASGSTAALNGTIRTNLTVTPIANSGANSFTITFASAGVPIAASSIYKITIESSDHVAVYELGDIGPGGGTIYYISATPFTESGASCASNCHYLEAAPTTGPSAWTEATYVWSGNTTTYVGTNTAIGTGYANTQAIIAQSGGGNTANKAATISAAFRGPNGLSDWFLPSKDELNQLDINQAYVADLVGNHHWSSSEFGAGQPANSDYENLSNANQYSGSKLNGFYVRPVRAF